MRIAILGWGSLIWDPRELPREGTWEKGGPMLPLEFSRVSIDGRLTLVIDPVHGVPVVTRFVLSPRADVDDAIADLRAREQTSSANIGFVDLRHNKRSSHFHPSAPDVVAEWAREHGFDAVVWTDLQANFRDEKGDTFSVERAEQYLLGLPKSLQVRARKYIQNAPGEVDTPLRRRLREVHWLES